MSRSAAQTVSSPSKNLRPLAIFPVQACTCTDAQIYSQGPFICQQVAYIIAFLREATIDWLPHRATILDLATWAINNFISNIFSKLIDQAELMNRNNTAELLRSKQSKR